MGDNYKLESIWKVAEIAVLSIQPLGVNRPTMRQVVSDLREAIEMETSMQSYDGSSISMQSDPSFAPTIARPTTATTMARNNTNNHHIPGSNPHVRYMSSSSETDNLQTNFPSSSSPDIMGMPYARQTKKKKERKEKIHKEKSKKKKEEEEKNKIVMFLQRNQISKYNVAQQVFSPQHQNNVQLQRCGAMALRIFLVVKMEQQQRFQRQRYITTTSL